MNRGIHSPPRLVALVACALAVVAAIGAVSPRLRAASRDRVIRAGVARASTLRTDGSRGWVAPINDYDLVVASVDTLVHRQAGPPGEDERRLVSLNHDSAFLLLPPPASPRLHPLPDRPRLRLSAGLIRSSAGRAPPPA